jgi:hypothetical protein
MKCIVIRIFLCTMLFLSCIANAIELDAKKAIVYQLYKDFGWSALFNDSDAAKYYLGKTIEEQSQDVLSKYFSPELVTLFLQEASCNATRKGELCNLEFDPIFASQDPAASELTISSVENDDVTVQFIYPSNGMRVILLYKIAKFKEGWRINDIVYPGSSVSSLKAILSR